ncbi:hypothetical protein BJX65DRAFT_308336 [Aspergillus insuetus]
MEHSVRRKVLSKVYSKSFAIKDPTRRLTTLSVLFDRLVSFIDKKAEACQPIKVFKLWYSYSLDSFTAHQFGLKLGSNALQDEKFAGLLKYLGRNMITKECLTSVKDLEAWHIDVCDLAEHLAKSGHH